MKQIIESEFTHTSWEEAPLSAADAATRLTQAKVTQSYTGDIMAESTLEYVIVYVSEQEARFVGMERFEGTVLGRSGTFALEHRGGFVGKLVTMQVSIVEGSATGELEGLSGSGEFESGHAETYTLALDIELPDRDA